MQHVARNQAGGLRFHDLRHSYATWLVDDGVPPNMVQRVMGHERSSTTLDLYTRRTDNSDRILQALNDPDEDDDPDDEQLGPRSGAEKPCSGNAPSIGADHAKPPVPMKIIDRPSDQAKYAAGRYWDRTSDLFGVNEALSP